jgi:hypothetical protein
VLFSDSVKPLALFIILTEMGMHAQVDVGMKKPHAKTLKAGWRKLKQGRS